MATEEKLTMSQTNPDGSQSVLEITAKTLSPEEVAADKSLFEKIIDAIFDFSDDDSSHTYLVATDPASDLVVNDPGPANVQDSWVPMLDGAAMAAAPVLAADNSMDFMVADSGETAIREDHLGDDHAQAARDAQAAADDFVDRGDYRAAAEARQQAEQAADLAGDSSMLGTHDAQHLGFAADRQDLAEQFQQEQADRIEQGDYEGARESAAQAGYATRDADSLAGGADHSGQSGRDIQNLDWANWQEKSAEENAFHAQNYAAEGDLEKAQMYGEQAAWQQSAADQSAERANPENLHRDYDPSAAVETGGSYDAALNSIDTGIDSSFDSGSTDDFSSSTDDMSC